MTNAQSLGNKFEEAEVVLQLNNVDICVITETWFSSNIPENQLSIPSYNLFFKDRDSKRGGGVGIYVKDDIPATTFDKIKVPTELECIWVKVRPERLLRSVSSIAVCAVYITTKSPHQNLLTDHLLSSVDFLRTKYPDIGILILGDFNRMNVNTILRGNDFKQLVDFPTRGDATLDLMLTSSKLNEYYAKPRPISPIGLSDHVSILWNPKILPKATMKSCSVKITRPLHGSGIRAFGSWIQGQNWDEVLDCDSTQDKTDAFYSILELGITKYFPEKKRKILANDKPWITDHVKQLIVERQNAFQSGNVSEWRKLRNLVKREVEKAKISYHANRVRHLQKAEPRKWYQELKKITNSTKKDLKLNIPGIDDKDGVGKANSINDMFANVSAHVPPLDFNELPAYLPSKEPPPHLYPWVVYNELKKINPNKSSGPDGVPAKLIKEFAYDVGTVVLTDFSKAFDLVNHTVLINKIIQMGVRRNIIPWICDFLHHRQQCVRYNSDLSNYVFLNGGVPQGTKFGPIGFQIIINNAAIGSHSQYWKYVDDLTFAENRKIGEKGGLQDDLNDFSEWARINQLKLNPSKCQALEICFNKSAPLHADLMIGSKKLSYVNKAKVLGVYLQNDLKWESQIENMTKKANQRLFMLRSLKNLALTVKSF
ncbi:uncharacterized protein [Amphiura filiformis]|uniref:uncharacterized protein n=1 Tax=Amphiura filiformis TaxID=82378 RepID=UPI003B218BB6